MNVFLTYQQLKIPVALLAFLADRMDICRLYFLSIQLTRIESKRTLEHSNNAHP